jgi:thiol-disulfide isomerase/thioredoxin
MEKWKIAGILAMLVAAVGYTSLQNRASENPTGTATPASGTSSEGARAAQATPARDPKLQALIGTSPRPWNLPASAWANTSKPLTLADTKGKVTLLEFWRSGCSHCEDAVPFMNAMSQAFKGRLQIITFQSPGDLKNPLNEENSWPKVQSWIKDHNVTYPVAFDAGRKLKDSYGIPKYPFLMLVNKQGKIVYATTGHTPQKAAELAAEITKLLGNPST